MTRPTLGRVRGLVGWSKDTWAWKEGKRWFYCLIGKLTIGGAYMKADRDPLYEVPKLGKDVLRQQCTVFGERGNVLANRLVSAPDLVTD